MKSAKPAISQAFRDIGAQALDSYAGAMDGLQLALLTTLDGFEIASLRRRADLLPNRLSAMASSLMAMGRAVGKEVQANACHRLIFEADGNTVVFQLIDGPMPCILCLVLGQDAVLGRALWVAAGINKALGGANAAQAPAG